MHQVVGRKQSKAIIRTSELCFGIYFGERLPVCQQTLQLILTNTQLWSGSNWFQTILFQKYKPLKLKAFIAHVTCSWPRPQRYCPVLGITVWIWTIYWLFSPQCPYGSGKRLVIGPLWRASVDLIPPWQRYEFYMDDVHNRSLTDNISSLWHGARRQLGYPNKCVCLFFIIIESRKPTRSFRGNWMNKPLLKLHKMLWKGKAHSYVPPRRIHASSFPVTGATSAVLTSFCSIKLPLFLPC